MTNEAQFFRKIYLSFYSKVLRKGYVWEVSWRLNKDCNVLTPSSSIFSITSFSFCWAAQPGTQRAQLSAGSCSHCLELQQTNSNSKLTRISCGTELYNCLTPTCFIERRICIQFSPSTVKVISWYLRPDAPVLRLTAGPKVNMLHVSSHWSVVIQQNSLSLDDNIHTYIYIYREREREINWECEFYSNNIEKSIFYGMTNFLWLRSRVLQWFG